VRSAFTVERDKRAWELRTASLTYAQIGAELGIAESAACESVMRGATLIPTEDIIELKKSELAKLDRIERYLLAVMILERLRVDHGHVVIDQGRPLLDDRPGVQAAFGRIRVQERRTRLCGLDAPTKFRVGVITEDMVEAEIRRLEQELASPTAEIEASPISEDAGR
jgi:hypothetical protein